MSEHETIHVEILETGIKRYCPVEAKRTDENFFEIVSEPPLGNSGSFQQGDIVRCAWRYFGQGFDGGIVAISQAGSSLPEFAVGDKVLVSEHAGWHSDFPGMVASSPEQSLTRLGTVTLYWVEFDEPQKERDEEFAYIKAQVSNVYIKLAK